MVVPNHFVGDSMNLIASCIDEKECMVVKRVPMEEVPTDIVTYPQFQPEPYLSIPTTVYIAHQSGYFQVKILRK